MLKGIALTALFVFCVNEALADNWSGKAVAPVVVLPDRHPVTLPSQIDKITLTCTTPTPPFEVRASSGKTCPTGTAPFRYTFLGSEGTIGDFNTTSQVASTPAGITAVGSTVSVEAAGTYPDATSPTGLSQFDGYLPLSDFATSSSVDALQVEVNQLKANLPYLKHYAAQGTAQALAMAGVGDIDPDQKVSISMNFGSYEGQSAAAVGLAVRVNRNASFNAGMSGMGSGTYGMRAGFRIGW